MQANRGSITAEWALALPAVMLVSGAVITGIGVGLDQASLHQAAADAARAASFGLTDADVFSRIRVTQGPEVSVDITRDATSHIVCVELAGPSRSAVAIDLLHPSSTMCALLPPELARE